MKVLGIRRDTTACNEYRVNTPLTKLREHGLCDVVLLDDTELSSEHALEKVLESDIIVFQRPANEEWFNFIKLCRKNGKIIVSDYDDDPFNTSPMNPYYRIIGVKEYFYKWPDGRVDQIWQDGENGFDIEVNIERREMFKMSFMKSDMVTTTTLTLRDTLSKMNSNIKILPNVLNFDEYTKADFNKKEVRIGYQGGASHYEDIYLIKDVLSKVMKENDNVKFIYFGDYRFENLFKDIPKDKMEFHGWIPRTAYPYKLSLLNLDIGLCPLVDNVFNRNKSSIKYFEYSAVGACTLASDVKPYSLDINGENALLAKPNEWESKLTELIKNKQLRNKLATNGYEDCFENHNIDKKIHLWADAYKSLMTQEVNV